MIWYVATFIERCGPGISEFHYACTFTHVCVCVCVCVCQSGATVHFRSTPLALYVSNLYTVL